MLKIKNEKEFDDLRVNRREQLMLLMILSEQSGLIKKPMLVKKYLNTILPTLPPTDKGYEVRTSLRYYRRNMINELFDKYLIVQK